MLQASNLLGRRKVLMMFINIARWVHTVHHLDILPSTPLKLLHGEVRTSPHDGMDKSLVTMHLTSVEKIISVPPNYLQTQVNVYGMLAAGVPGGVPGAVKCSVLKVSGSFTAGLSMNFYWGEAHVFVLYR